MALCTQIGERGRYLGGLSPHGVGSIRLAFRTNGVAADP